MVTIRMALAVFVRSPAAYEALKEFGMMQLPSRSTLQSYTGAFLDEPGKYIRTSMHLIINIPSIILVYL